MTREIVIKLADLLKAVKENIGDTVMVINDDNTVRFSPSLFKPLQHSTIFNIPLASDKHSLESVLLSYLNTLNFNSEFNFTFDCVKPVKLFPTKQYIEAFQSGGYGLFLDEKFTLLLKKMEDGEGLKLLLEIKPYDVDFLSMLHALKIDMWDKPLGELMLFVPSNPKTIVQVNEDNIAEKIDSGLDLWFTIDGVVEEKPIDKPFVKIPTKAQFSDYVRDNPYRFNYSTANLIQMFIDELNNPAQWVGLLYGLKVTDLIYFQSKNDLIVKHTLEMIRQGIKNG